MSQSPLRLCSSLHDKFVLVLGQKDIKDTAFSYPFSFVEADNHNIAVNKIIP